MNQPGGQISIDWNTPPGQVCQVQYTTNLSQTEWINLGGLLNVTNGSVDVIDTVTNSQCFYRLVVLP